MPIQNDWRAFIPPAMQDAAERAIGIVFGTTAIQEVTPLTGGGSSAILLKLLVADRSYVLRLIPHIHAFNAPARQFACLNIASKAGISPRVHYTNAADAIAITDFIAPTPFSKYPGSPLLGLVETIRAIHAAPLFPSLVNYMDKIDDFIQTVRASGMLSETATKEHFEYYAQIQAAYPRHDPDCVSSHNDLNPRNILFDGTRFWVIDWETAFPNDRYADLANVAGFFLSDEPEAEEAFLRAYFGDTLDDYKRARFFLMRQINHMYYAMILMLSASGTPSAGGIWDDAMETPRLREFHGRLADASGGDLLASAEGRYLYGKVRLNEALQGMKMPRFADSIRRMS